MMRRGPGLRKCLVALLLLCAATSVGFISSLLQSGGRYSGSVHQLQATRRWHHQRNVLWQERWMERERSEGPTTASGVLSTVHYLWCGRQTFRFHHYLGLLSALRVLQPRQVVFHYTHLPILDDYNTWFLELQASVSHLQMVPAAPSVCRPDGVLGVVAAFLASSPEGAIFLGPGLILTQPPIFSNSMLWAATAPTCDQVSAGPVQVIVALRSRTDSDSLLRALTSSLTSASSSSTSTTSSSSARCASMLQYNDSAVCVAVETGLYPRDIVRSPSPLAELARWLFYGRRAPLGVRPDPGPPIPRISHYVMLTSPEGSQPPELTFSQYLSILSALYMGGFKHVYLHANQQPRGRWWDALTKENVTFAAVDSRKFQPQPDPVPASTVSDLAKYQIVHKHGGTYQDFDVFWWSPIPDRLLMYPAVLGVERTARPWVPEPISSRVMSSAAGGGWLGHFLQAARRARWTVTERDLLYLAYRTYELYPDQVYLDRHLRVLCWATHHWLCHPANREDETEQAGLRTDNWRAEVRAFHIPGPQPHPSLVSPQAVAERKGFFAQLGRDILAKSGHLRYLPSFS